ncbi:MAG: AAA family ATPase [Candidatus Sericytochromatia bacterium]|nr:AAA family ATPase [Candidatus Tanganyikabacteria bacterium]
MECSACGAQVPAGANFCTWCGSSLSAKAAAPAPPAPLEPTAIAPPAGGGPEIFVGREAEWESLRRIFARASAGRPQFALISGDPGVGKSALSRRFLGHVAEAGARVVTARLAGGGREGGTNLLRELVCDLLDIDPTWGAAELRGHLERALPGDEAGSREADLFGYLCGLAPRNPRLVALEARALRRGAWEAFADHLTALAASRPVVIGLGDIQQADAASLEWLDALCWHLGQVQEVAIMAIGQFRTGSLDPLPGIDSPIDLTSIALRPLPPAEARVLATALLPDSGDDLISGAIARAEGNPFFLTQLLAAALERPGGSPLPDSIRAAVGARLDTLAPASRAVLDLAAIAGRVFDLQVVAEAAGRDISPEVAAFGSARFWLVRPDLQVEFAQTLVHECAEAAIPRERRAELHLLVGRALERRLGPRAAGRLAWHFAEAGAAGRTAYYSWLAGCQARSACAISDAGEHFAAALVWLDRAPAGTPDLPDRAEILLRLAGTARAVGQYGPALSHLDARAFFTPETAASLRERGEVLYRKGELSGALSSFERAISLAAAEPAEAALAEAGAANILRLMGDLRGAAARAHAARATLEGLGRSADAAFASSVAGICLFRSGRFAEALSVHEGALALREAAGDVEGIARSHSNLGITHAALGNRDAAQVHHTKALALFRRLADRRSISQSLTNLGDLLLGDPASTPERLELAARHFEEALKIARQLEDTDTAIADLGSLADLALRRGNEAYALAAVDECLALMRASGHGEHAASIHATRGRALLQRGDAAAAREALDTARSLAESAGDAPLAEKLGRELAALGRVRG